MSRGQIIPKILEILQSQAETTVSLFDAFTLSYGESHRKMHQVIKYGFKRFKADWAFLYRERQQFYSLLNQLKNQGFIEKKKTSQKQSLWKITKRGREKIRIIRKFNFFKKASVIYKKEDDDKVKVITFDIPERERNKREWLRAVLSALGFTLLQQSVWIGKNKIPEKFLFDLKDREMLPYIHIFKVDKKGTIKEIF
ncbi:MAG: hypothetical protein LiPW39_556 [Parcubacteria group bacterium LiPW_39]|nr:MAG: hypothetical protein LiPW39_556 [Parcubacteria group bacterium LiPW_39]